VGENARAILHEARYNDVEIDELIRLKVCGISGADA
jgi:hypothetical protein